MASDDGRWRPLRRGFVIFCLASGFVWILLFGFFVAFPYVRNGADVIFAAKVAYLESQPVFSPDARARVLAFGDSKVLAGFVPSIFDETLGPGVESFNAGLPASNRFVGVLGRMLERGTRPTHVLVAVPPADERPLGWLELLRDDKRLVNLLFPFRTLPRDLTLFLFHARHDGGIVESYRKNARTVAQVLAARGFYFLERQSHFAGDSLPDSYSLPTDTPGSIPSSRVIDPKSPGVEELVRLATAYGFTVIFVPTMHRTREYAPPDPGAETRISRLGTGPAYFAGPQYWLFPPRYFSDPTHLNKEGAALYTRRLAELTSALVRGGD